MSIECESSALDKRFKIDRPETFIVEASGDSLHLGIKSKDKLIINRALTPQPGQLVLLVVKNRFLLTSFSPEQLEGQDSETQDFVWGVVSALLREFP